MYEFQNVLYLLTMVEERAFNLIIRNFVPESKFISTITASIILHVHDTDGWNKCFENGDKDFELINVSGINMSVLN